MMRTLRLTMAQVNPTVGDLTGNRDKVLHALRQAAAERSKLVIFPELVITGYPPEDLLHHSHFVRDNLKMVESLLPHTRGLAAVVGFVDQAKNGSLYNAAAILADGKKIHVYHKIDLPNYGVFDEKRYFVPGRKGCVLEAGEGVRVGITVCEDIWLPTSLVNSADYRGAVSLLVNISASPYQMGKHKIRENIVKTLARRARTSVVYENLIGGQDELVFDGSGMAVEGSGSIIFRQPRFAENVQTFDMPLAAVSKKTLPRARFDIVKAPVLRSGVREGKARNTVQNTWSSSPEKEVYDALVLGTRDYIQKNRFQKAVIGLSGGIDSALVACIAVDAVGKNNVLGVTMPSGFTSGATKSDAHLLAKNLGIRCLELPIGGPVGSYLKLLKKTFAGSKPDTTEENLQARVRGNILMAISNKWGHLVLTTGNKSEMATGYCTLYGDMAGGFAVIKDIPKMLVYRLSRYRNKLSPKPVIPVSTILRAPTAELRPNQKDQDTLPPYAQLDNFLEAYVEKGEHIQKAMAKYKIPKDLALRLSRMIDGNEYKRRQAPPGIKITSRAFGKDRRMPITNRYRSGHDIS